MLRIYLLFIALFVSCSAFSETGQNSLFLPFANTITLSNSASVNISNSVSVNIIEDGSISPQLSETAKTPLQPISKHLSKPIDFVESIQNNQLYNIHQPSPKYFLLYELLIEKTNFYKNLEDTLPQPPEPWFMNYSGSIARLSGWKDSNSQYTSKITYHIS